MAQVRIGRVGKPHGIRGEVTVTPLTDDPSARFVAGSVFTADPANLGPLRVIGSRRSGPVLVVGFDGYADRNAAEMLRGTVLLLDADELPPAKDDDEFYDHELVGLAVRDASGTQLGQVTGIFHPPAAPVLQVLRPDGSEELVPFVKVIVPEVDLIGGFLVVHPPDGMFA